MKELTKAYRKRSYQGLNRICYCHVPKCAGISVSSSIANQFFTRWERRLFPNFSIDLKASSRAATLTSRPMMELREELLAYALSTNRYKYVSGHVACRPRLVDAFHDTWHFVTVLRRPVDRWISEFVYNTEKSSSWSRNNLPIDAYLGSPISRATATSYLRYFSSIRDGYDEDIDTYIDEAVSNLAKFSVVGIVEEMDAFVRAFARALGRELNIPRRNSSPSSDAKERIESDGALMAAISELCEADTRIYVRALRASSAFAHAGS